MIPITASLPLAPLQQIMLRDSLAEPTAGYHVEQVEIVLKRSLTTSRVATAWADTVAAAEVLRTGFRVADGARPVGHAATNFPGLEIHHAAPPCMNEWLKVDRFRPILFPDRVPWRMVFWPAQRRLVWTFHHALLDGRSIARIAASFLTRLGGKAAVALPRSCWQPPPRECIALAAEIFRRIPTALAAVDLPRDLSAIGQARSLLGNVFLKRLEERANSLETAATTVVTWAWGQAIAGFLGNDAVLAEQVRVGAPRPGTAGFTMNVLPLVIERSGVDGIPHFRRHLRMLREIESVSSGDFEPGVFPDVDAPGVSMIMVENATLAHAVGHQEITDSVVLHEREADTLMATAHLFPDLYLQVEGPHRHELLKRWVEVLKEVTEC